MGRRFTGNSFCGCTAHECRWDHRAGQCQHFRPPLQRPRAKMRIFPARAAHFTAFLAARVHSTCKGTGAFGALASVCGLCAQIGLRLGRWWLCNDWQYSSAHDHHGCAAASASQLGTWRGRSGAGRWAAGQVEHQQLQQRNHALAIGMQKTIIARAPKPLGQHMLQHQP